MVALLLVPLKHKGLQSQKVSGLLISALGGVPEALRHFKGCGTAVFALCEIVF